MNKSLVICPKLILQQDSNKEWSQMLLDLICNILTLWRRSGTPTQLNMQMRKYRAEAWRIEVIRIKNISRKRSLMTIWNIRLKQLFNITRKRLLATRIGGLQPMAALETKTSQMLKNRHWSHIWHKMVSMRRTSNRSSKARFYLRHKPCVIKDTKW